MSAILPLVCFAMPQEAAPFRKIWSETLNAQRSEEEREKKLASSVQVLVTGMGRANSERTLAPQLARQTPAFVLTCGFAGGLDPALQLNTLLFESEYSALVERLTAAGIRRARFHCATRMAVTAAEKAALRRETGADAVEMESAYVQRMCRERGVACATVRVISDAADEDMPLDFNTLTTQDMRMHYGKLALAIAKSPGTIRGLVRLQRQTAAAAEALAAGLCRVISNQ